MIVGQPLRRRLRHIGRNIDSVRLQVDRIAAS
jgi:hypothetical protein